MLVDGLVYIRKREKKKTIIIIGSMHSANRQDKLHKGRIDGV